LGGKFVKLERTLFKDEMDLINEILIENDRNQRKTMVAFIIMNALSSNDNKAIANLVLEQFSILSSKDPLGTTRSLVTRIINDINQGKTTHEIIKNRGKGLVELTRWTDALFKSRILEHHNKSHENFTYTTLKQSDFKLISHIEQYRDNFKVAMQKVGINPMVHLEDVPWIDKTNSKALLEIMIKDIVFRCGVESLNYHSMITTQSAILGIQENFHEEFPECKKFGCIRRVPGSAIIKKMTDLYGSYKHGVCELLLISSDDYEELIEKKPQEVPIATYLDRLRNFIDTADEDWTIADFMRADRSAHRGLHNKKDKLKFIDQVYGDVMVAAVLQIFFEDSDNTEATFFEHSFDDLVRETKSRRVSNIQIRLEGYRFQEVFLQMLTDNRVGLIIDKDFTYERFIDRAMCEHLGHSPDCKVDFAFPNCIIDTKRSVTAGRRVANQTLRYLDHTNHLIRVTLRQRYRTELIKSKRLTTLTVYDFIERSHQYIGVSIPKDWIGRFEIYEKESASRIQEALGD
jgi:hypothetical protein